MNDFVYIVYTNMRTIEKITTEKPIDFKIGEGIIFSEDFYKIERISTTYDLNLNKVIICVRVESAVITDFDTPIQDDY